MYQVIEMNELMRKEETKQDPILQTKNSDMLRLTSGLRHQCTLVRNLMFSYLYNISKVKMIFECFNKFFDDFSDFDKDHKDFYKKAKTVIGNQEFYDIQGIAVEEVFEDIQQKKKAKKERESEETKSCKSNEECQSENDDKTEESDSDSNQNEEIDAKVILPENIGKFNYLNNF